MKWFAHGPAAPSRFPLSHGGSDLKNPWGFHNRSGPAFSRRMPYLKSIWKLTPANPCTTKGHLLSLLYSPCYFFPLPAVSYPLTRPNFLILCSLGKSRRKGDTSKVPPPPFNELMRRIAALISEHGNAKSPCLEKVNFPKHLGKPKASELLLIGWDSWEEAHSMR